MPEQRADSELHDRMVAPSQAAQPRLPETRAIPIEAVLPYYQPRQTTDVARQAELTSSVAAVGILVPLMGWAVPSGHADHGRIRLIDGHRRLAAAQANGLQTVPINIRYDWTEHDARLAGLVANLQRRGLNQDEFTAACIALEQQGITVAKIAAGLGYSSTTISRLLGVVESPVLTEAVLEGILSHDAAARLLPRRTEAERQAWVDYLRRRQRAGEPVKRPAFRAAIAGNNPPPVDLPPDAIVAPGPSGVGPPNGSASEGEGAAATPAPMGRTAPDSRHTSRVGPPNGADASAAAGSLTPHDSIAADAGARADNKLSDRPTTVALSDARELAVNWQRETLTLLELLGDHAHDQAVIDVLTIAGMAVMDRLAGAAPHR